jgi:hypothetical protein
LGDPYAELDDLIREIDRAVKVLKKIKGTQVRNAEDRDFLRSTALSWFHTRRSSVAEDMGAEVLEHIDIPYRTILDAADRHSSKNTYISAAKLAKQTLIEARSRALTPAPATATARTVDSAPQFAPLVADPSMQRILERRWDECKRCIDAGAPLAATVMMGGLLEALLVGRANKLPNKTKLFKAAATPVDPKTKKPLDLRQWTLGPYIDVGHELGWISDSARHVAVILRDYRNYIHPEKERSHGIVLSSDDALMFWEITKTLSRELLAMKGEM